MIATVLPLAVSLTASCRFSRDKKPAHAWNLAQLAHGSPYSLNSGNSSAFLSRASMARFSLSRLFFELLFFFFAQMPPGPDEIFIIDAAEQPHRYGQAQEKNNPSHGIFPSCN